MLKHTIYSLNLMILIALILLIKEIKQIDEGCKVIKKT